MNRPKPRVTTTLLARRARALKRHLVAAAAGEGVGIHQARVASRRLREALPVLTAGLKGSKAGKARGKIRRVTRALGAVRELDVTVRVLDELAARNTLPRNAIEEVRGHVVAERERRGQTMLKRLEQVNTEKLDRRLATVGEALQQARTEDWRQVLGSRLVRRSKALRTAIAEAGQMYASERLHVVRIAVKKLRYAMEIAAETRARAAAPLVRIMKRAQDSLGRLHDLQVLQQHVAEVQAAPRPQSLPDGGLDLLQRALEDECRHLHARYVADIPRLLDVVERTRAIVVPQLTRAGRLRRGTLKMALPGNGRGALTGSARRAAGRRA